MKMVKITGDLAKACGVEPDAEPMPLGFIEDVIREQMKGAYPRLPGILDIAYPPPLENQQ